MSRFAKYSIQNFRVAHENKNSRIAKHNNTSVIFPILRIHESLVPSSYEMSKNKTLCSLFRPPDPHQTMHHRDAGPDRPAPPGAIHDSHRQCLGREAQTLQAQPGAQSHHRARLLAQVFSRPDHTPQHHRHPEANQPGQEQRKKEESQQRMAPPVPARSPRALLNARQCQGRPLTPQRRLHIQPVQLLQGDHALNNDVQSGARLLLPALPHPTRLGQQLPDSSGRQKVCQGHPGRHTQALRALQQHSCLLASANNLATQELCRQTERSADRGKLRSPGRVRRQ